MKSIGVQAHSLQPGHKRFFDALTKLFDVRFEYREIGQEKDAWLLYDVEIEEIERIKNMNCPCFNAG